MASKIEQIISFKTSDGKVFENKQKAEAHQAANDLLEFLKSESANGVLAVHTVFNMVVMYPEVFKAVVDDHLGGVDHD